MFKNKRLTGHDSPRSDCAILGDPVSLFPWREPAEGNQVVPYHTYTSDTANLLPQSKRRLESVMESLKNILLTWGVPGLFFICLLDSAGVPLPGGPAAVVMLLSWQRPNLLVWIALAAALEKVALDLPDQWAFPSQDGAPAWDDWAWMPGCCTRLSGCLSR